MTKKQFQKEVDRAIYDTTEIAYMATDVTDDQRVFEAGQNFLQELEDADQELERALRQENIQIP